MPGEHGIKDRHSTLFRRATADLGHAGSWVVAVYRD